MKQTFKIPLWPPSTNAIWRNVRIHGKQKTLLSKAARTYYRQGANFIISPPEPIDGDVIVNIDLHTPHYQPYDVDNRIKAVLDLLTKCGVWYDDKQVVEITARKHARKSQALVVITVTPLETMQNDSQNTQGPERKAETS